MICEERKQKSAYLGGNVRVWAAKMLHMNSIVLVSTVPLQIMQPITGKPGLCIKMLRCTRSNVIITSLNHSIVFVIKGHETCTTSDKSWS